MWLSTLHNDCLLQAPAGASEWKNDEPPYGFVPEGLKEDRNTTSVRLGEQFNPQYIVDTLTFTRCGPDQRGAALLTMLQLKIVDAGRRCQLFTQLTEDYRVLSNPLPRNVGGTGNQNAR